VLHTASKNQAARAFFAALGFRETMIELTAEL
jgi:predicted GNAT family acetyltransferase